MQTTITHTCGHTETVQMYGTSKERDSKAAWLAGKACCWPQLRAAVTRLCHAVSAWLPSGSIGGDSESRLQSRGSLPSSPKNRAARGFQRRIRLLLASTCASGIGSACARPGQLSDS